MSSTKAIQAQTPPNIEKLQSSPEQKVKNEDKNSQEKKGQEKGSKGGIQWGDFGKRIDRIMGPVTGQSFFEEQLAEAERNVHQNWKLFNEDIQAGNTRRISTSIGNMITTVGLSAFAKPLK